jgi:hypothetical protein
LLLMEKSALKKTLLYIFSAVILGLLLTLIPAITIEKAKAHIIYISVLQEAQGIHGFVSTQNAPVHVEIFIISFAIASVAYFWVKRKTLSH